LFHVEQIFTNMNSNIKESLKNLPHKPGIYKFFDRKGKIIYVGKAKDLKRRVSSYFHKKHDRYKTKVLVKNTVRLEHFVVDTETDALLLENNLIKKHRPRYNVLLKDDKSYPFICIKNEKFPRVFQTRNPVKDGSLYFGPYTSIYMVRTLLKLFKKIFKLRTCKYNLSEENIAQKKFKVCLEYHIGNCLAPCVGEQTEEDYNRQITQIQHILKGNLKPVLLYLEERMNQHVKALEFEAAAEVKEQLDSLKNYESRSTVVSTKIGNIDVFNVVTDEKFAYVNLLKVANGAIIQIHNTEIRMGIDDDLKDVLLLAVTDIIHSKMAGFTNADEIVVPFSINYPFPNVKVTVPKIGDKKKLLELSEKNLKYYKAERIKNRNLTDPHRHTKRILKQIKKDLRLSELPVHIECFDNSNIQGTNPVSACVVFKNTRPSKKDYRKFNIKTVDKPDDFASMYEVVYRRYKRLVEEDKSLPQLIIIDGGKGQLSAAYKALKELNLQHEIAVIGIAKRLEEIFFPGDKLPLYLDKNSESLKVIQHARNEAHRFSIDFHRTKRSGNFIKSELENIRGVGPKTVSRLISHFGSVQSIKNSKENELGEIVGEKRAKIIKNYFNSAENNTK
jgi:excinuclease ABC subunit C